MYRRIRGLINPSLLPPFSHAIPLHTAPVPRGAVSLFSLCFSGFFVLVVRFTGRFPSSCKPPSPHSVFPLGAYVTDPAGKRCTESVAGGDGHCRCLGVSVYRQPQTKKRGTHPERECCVTYALLPPLRGPTYIRSRYCTAAYIHPSRAVPYVPRSYTPVPEMELPLDVGAIELLPQIDVAYLY